MLCLSFAELNSTAGLGPVLAIGVAVTMVVMVTLLPALLVICGRWVFWPKRPAFRSAEPTADGLWARVGRAISPRPRRVWIVTTGLLPVMPRVAPQVLAAIGVPNPPTSFDALRWGGLPTDAPLPAPAPLFPRIDKEAYLGEARAQKEKTMETTTAAPEKSPTISVDQFFQAELKVATIVAAEPVPKSNKLLKLTADLGEGSPRTIVAGIALAYKPEELVGKQVVVVANLQPAKLMGVESNGMVLAAPLDGKPVLLHPDAQVPNGTRVK
jgi:methionine--tRNA ligase beta chain